MSATNHSENRFNQSEAVTRCRGIKESKLKGQYALAKLVDEEVTIHSANLDEGRSQLNSQLFEIRMIELKQIAEAEDGNASRIRKHQFTQLVDKLTALKLMLRFQQDSYETERAFKLSIRHKRAAFQNQLSRLEKRQIAERNELIAAQQRLENTRRRIQDIDISNMADRKLAAVMKIKYDALAQQNQMKQTKESQFLREVQLCKSKQLRELTELEINNAEELQEFISAHKSQEFELIAKHKLIEADNEAALEKQIADARAVHVVERQKVGRIQLNRLQRRQAAALAKTQKAASRLRERNMLAENPVILGARGEASDLLDNSERDSTTSDATSRTFSTMSGATVESNGNGNEQEQSEDAGEGNVGADMDAQVRANSEQNKSSAAGAGAGAGQVLTEEEREIQALNEAGHERNRNAIAHHKNIVKELKSQQKSQLSLKIREQKRKVSELIKEHQEEMLTLKAEQDQVMAELLASQTAAEETSTATAATIINVSSNLIPEHIRADIASGNTPQSLKFDSVSVASIHLHNFESQISDLSPESIISYIKIVEEIVDREVSKHQSVFKLQFENGVITLIAGLSADNVSGTSHIASTTSELVECILNLKSAFSETFIPSTSEYIAMKTGIHVGSVSGGLIGATYPVYHAIGAGVDAAKALSVACTEPGRIQVSQVVQQDTGLESSVEGTFFEESDVVDVEGVGKVSAYWLHVK